MSGTVQETFSEDEFQDLLDDAESNAESNWEEEFISGLKARFASFGGRMFISEAQIRNVERIAEKTRG